MNVGFREGYEYFQNNAGAIVADFQGGNFGTYRAEYVESVEDEIYDLEKAINSFMGENTPAKQLKGDVAEFWHAHTFNVDASINESSHRAYVDRSHEFASKDLSTNFGDGYGLKYYANATESAKQQAKSVFERFKDYQNAGGKDSLEKFLTDRNYSDDSVLNDPIYSGQYRLIPSDQFEEAKKWLEHRIATESIRRPEQVKRYQEALDMLRDRVYDSEGNSSLSLTKIDAEKLAAEAKKGEFNAKEYGIEAPELLSADMILKEALKAGETAAIISLVIKVAPEIYNAIDYLIKNGEIEEDQFKRIGFAAITGASEGFVRGCVASAITICCKSGAFGETLQGVQPGVVGAIVSITMMTMKNAFQVAIGKKSREEMTNELIQSLFVTASSLTFGYAIQSLTPELPVIGYLIGSFVGSITGSFIYNVGYKTTLSFCVDTGVTLFGIVDQDYQLPDDVIDSLGIATLKYDTFDYSRIAAKSFEIETFDFETFVPDGLEIKFLRRGVIGVTKIGYV